MELLEQIEAFLAQTKTPPSKFGRMAVGDPRFVDDLRAGRRPRRKTEERVQAYLFARERDHRLRNASSAIASAELSRWGTAFEGQQIIGRKLSGH